jgi:hypothetical protein
MGTVAAYDMASIQAALGGSNPISLDEYYRGGAYVPTTATGTVREPTTGEYYQYPTPTPTYCWGYLSTPADVNSASAFITWNSVLLNGTAPPGSTSYTEDGYTYYRGSYKAYRPSTGKTSLPNTDYAIYRTGPATAAINTGVPSSGTISIANLYGAQNP